MASKARTSAQAIKRYKKPLQLALSCLTSSNIWIIGRPRDQELQRLAIGGGGIVQIRGGTGDPLYLDVSQIFAVYPDGEQFRVSTKGYLYTLSASERLETEIVSWHWHPPSRSRPHLHTGDHSLGHIPTGRVTFESVVRYAIEDLGAKPARADWDDVLMQTEALHTKYRSWNVAPEVEP